MSEVITRGQVYVDEENSNKFELLMKKYEANGDQTKLKVQCEVIRFLEKQNIVLLKLSSRDTVHILRRKKVYCGLIDSSSLYLKIKIPLDEKIKSVFLVYKSSDKEEIVTEKEITRTTESGMIIKETINEKKIKVEISWIHTILGFSIKDKKLMIKLNNYEADDDEFMDLP